MTIFNRRGEQDPTPQFSNSGVINTGSASNIQNQPGAVGSHQSQVNVTSDAAVSARWTQTLADLDAALARERDRVTDPERCRVLLGLVRDQQLTDEGGRLVARTMLGQLSALCGGAPGVASLITSALSVLDTAIG
ncbi:hypothetical protein ABT009_30645 [Streptomyces sp. NPDC002896]|uniref:hypothetical protein n=1 Tax=Streptomyces sp. NPDC002896 TaxID=3154438 RepID=UPI0033243CD2